MISNRIYSIIIWLVLIIMSLFVIKSIKSANFLAPIVFISSLVMIYLIIKFPAKGLIVIPFVSYLLPESFRIYGNSPGFLVSVIVLFSAFIHITTQKIRIKIPWLWLLMIFMLLNVFIVSPSLNGIFINFLQQTNLRVLSLSLNLPILHLNPYL